MLLLSLVSRYHFLTSMVQSDRTDHQSSVNLLYQTNKNL